MPLWQIHHSENTFTTVEEKQALVNDITAMYTPSLPAFYIIVQFFPTTSETAWQGGENKRTTPFIRFVISHIAITGSEYADVDAFYKRVVGLIDGVLKPHVQEKGYDWEYHVVETDRRLWKTNGLIPPKVGSDEHKEWMKANEPLPWEGDH